MTAQAVRCKVNQMDKRMQEIEAGGGQNHAPIPLGPGSAKAKSDSKCEKGSAKIAHEVDI